MFPHTTWQSVHSLSKISWGKITSERLPCLRLAQESQSDSLSVKLNLWILCSSSGTSVGPSRPGSLTRSWGPFLPVYGFVLGHIFLGRVCDVSQFPSLFLWALVRSNPFCPSQGSVTLLRAPPWLSNSRHSTIMPNKHQLASTPCSGNSASGHCPHGPPTTGRAFGSSWSEPPGTSQDCFCYKWPCLLSFPHTLTSPQHHTLL